MKGQDVLFSHKSDNYITPKWLFKELDDEFHFQLDACTASDNPLGTEYFYTEDVDGLKYNWWDSTYCNPPYSQVDKWVEKAFWQMIEGKTVVMLLPSRTGTKWFHKWIWNKEQYGPRLGIQVRFLEKRLKFQGTNNSAPFDSMVVIFR